MENTVDKYSRKKVFHAAHVEQDVPIRRLAVGQLEQATEQLNRTLRRLELEVATPGADMHRLTAELTRQVRNTEDVARRVESELADDPLVLKRVQAEFRQRTDPFFSKSYFMHRARVWPRGYPGDYQIIDQAYDNRILSEGIGALLDRYFLDSTLAEAIRWRRLKMRDVLAEQMLRRPRADILNIGCGPCREVIELAPIIAQSKARFMCLDFDDEALAYAANRLAATEAAGQVRFRQYNALRMVSASRNLQTFGKQDIIYTIGLLDYLTDEVLIRMIRSLRETLKPGGMIVAVFKDSTQYDTQDYHWLVDWSGFYQRTAAESLRLIEAAGVVPDSITIDRSQCGVMVFYQIAAASQLQTIVPRPHRAIRHTAGRPTATEDRSAR